MGPQAEALNNAIKDDNPAIYGMLSGKGREIYFPARGILTQTAEAKGKRINASIGTAIEDDGTPMRLQCIAKHVLLDPNDAFSYAPSYGKPELRKAWEKLMLRKNPSLRGRISLPVATAALTHGLSVAAYMFADPGDRIILTDRHWENYRLIFTGAYGAVLDTFSTFKSGGFDTGSFRKKLEGEPGKRLVLLNFPNNPSGYTPTEKEATEIVKAIKESAELGSRIVAICDDAYFGLVYRSGVLRESLFSRLADLHGNVLAVKIDGPTKECYVWGFRVGFITYASKGITAKTCRALEDKTAGVVRGSISNAPNVSQSLILRGLESPAYEREAREKYAILKSRYEEVVRVLADKKYAACFTPLPFNSGYFMCVELAPGIDAEKVRRTLLEKYDTGVISTGILIRVAYSSVAKKDIRQLFENIHGACMEQKK